MQFSSTATGGGGSVATDTIFDAKGDLAVGTGANTAEKLTVGANGTVLMADSTADTGVKWETVAGTGDVTAAAAFTNDNRLLRSDGTGKGAQASSVSLTDTADMSGVATLVVTSSAAIGTAATNGELAILNDAGGSITLSVPSVTAARVVDFPDVAGTIAVGTFNSQYNVAGDILYASAADTGARLAIGTANQLLQTNAGATAPEWTSNPTVTTLTATTANVSLVRPATDDGAPLGDNTHHFSDLFLASGGTINYQNGNVVITHGSGLVTVTTGEFRITTPGTNAASVPTLGSTSTLTNKTLTSPTLTAPVLGTPASGNLSNCTADGTNAVGFRHVPQNSQSAAYTTVLADAGKHILHPSADTTARTMTIDSNANVAYPVGTAITFVNQDSAGVMTIAITTDTMRLAGAGTTGSRTLAANGIATALKVTTTEWIISGTGLT